MKYFIVIFFLIFPHTFINAQVNEIETSAEYKGGEEALLAFISKHLKYPHRLAGEIVDGKIVFTFTVKKDGSTDSIKLLKPLSATLEEEITKTIKSMPRWKPATKNNIPISSIITIPMYITFEEDL